jgi:hypothetical protein
MTEFDSTRFTPEQIAELKGSAISPEIADRHGLYSVNDSKAAAKLFGRLARHWEGHLPVLVFPYLLPFQRDPVLVRGKPTRPFEVRKNDGSVSLVKYVQAKDTGSHIAFGASLLEGQALRDIKIPLWISEGEKKMLSAESHGLSCIALPGVTQWHLKGAKTLHPYFAHVTLEGRAVYLAFDADSLANKDVRKQELEFGRALEKAGAVVYIVRFPQDASKLDDFLATHELTELDQLMADARKGGRLPPDTSTVAASEEWASVFEKLRIDDEKGLPIKDVDNVSYILLYHPAWQGVLAFDSRRERQVFQKQPPFSTDMALDKAPIPRAIIDSDATRIASWLVAQDCLGWALQPKTSQIEQAISIVCERNRFDAVRDYLVGLKWDGTPRLDSMAAVYFDAQDDVDDELDSDSADYTSTVFAKWMLSAVARARTPGCQVDHLIVLEGPQGIGKSTALRILAGTECFSDTLPEIPSRDAHEHCIGPWVVELAELDHMRKSEVTALKAFISARAPSFRAAYARRTIEHPRRCVFAATTNESGYLADPTGNRRFWPIACTRIDLEALARDRDQLWAEALHRVRAGESWHITDQQVAAKVLEAQASRRQADPWQPQVVSFVKGRDICTVGDVLDYLGHGPEDAPLGFSGYQRERGRKGWQYDQRSANRVSAILRELGWVRRMVRDGEYRVWKYESPGKKGELVTTRGATGDRPVTPKVVDIKNKSPLSPLSPDDPLYTVRAGARDAGTPRAGAGGIAGIGSSSFPSIHPVLDLTTGDSSDSGSNGVGPDTSSVTTLSPLSEGVVTPSEQKPRRVF